MELWSFIHNHLAENKRVVLIAVIECKGSSPGRVGFKMAISEDSSIAGSIGGGVMEYNMVELARKIVKSNSSEITIKRQIHDSEAEYDKSGMICSGEQTHAFVPLSNSNLACISQIKDCIDNGEKGILTISPKNIHFSREDSSEYQISSFINSPNDWEYKEQIGLKDTIYIFGAGHISVPLSQILRMLDFRVVVFDNRKELSTYTANNFAHEKQIIDYHDVADLVTDGLNSYVAIMSFGHKFDQIILKQLLPKMLKYIGMIGSKNKVQSIYDSLREFGFKDNDFARVDSPIGLSINSQTPAEIAISIAAKIIHVRNGEKK
ncbi:MAG: XdhC family protein [Tenuifilaceae bacterium]